MSSKPATLVVLSPAFAKTEADSWLPAQENLIRAMNRVDPALKIIILTFHFPVVAKRQYSWHGNEVFAFGGQMKGGLHSLVLWAKVWRQLIRLKKQHHIIGIFSFFCSESAFIGHYFALIYRLKHRIWVLGQDAKKENNQVRRIRPKPTELVVISDFLQRTFLQNHGIKPATIIPIGIDPSQFEHTAAEQTIDLLGVGSLIPLKQYDVFIEVVMMIAEKMPAVKAVLSGHGPEQEHLTALINNYQLASRITMIGQTNHSQVLKLMQASKVLLHPSAYEGFGAVCLEALYAGAQVISFCKPMDAAISHWHIVANKEEMAAKAIELLTEEKAVHKPILPYPISASASAILQLFDRPGDFMD